jgi:structural maintenance of chromosome 4
VITDKTDEFTSQIEALQRELEPWVAKINDRQSAADIAESEKKTLSGKAIAGQKAVDTAHSALEALVQAVQSKVKRLYIPAT